MRIISITNVKNEIDIIEAFVRHTSTLVNRLVILDNGSTDGTLDVLRALRAEGLPLEIVEDPTPGYYQHARMTRLLHEHAPHYHDADWTLPLDADEFLVLSPEAERILAEADPERPLCLPWHSYVPSASDEPGQANPVVRIRHRLAEEPRRTIKVVVPAALALRPEVALGTGSHDLTINNKPIEPANVELGHLAHFPLRSADQYLAKMVVGTLQVYAMDWALVPICYHWKAAFDRLKRDPETTAHEFRDIAMRYVAEFPEGVTPKLVDDPICYQGGELLHTAIEHEHSRALRSILVYAEQLARNHGTLRTRVEELQRNLEYHKEILDQTRQEIVDLKSSWTWRSGRLLVSPIRKLKDSLDQVRGRSPKSDAA
ncbi:MAG: glycosyltransferase family 2 protein [Gemmataceae bacterium]|nr:glycosyltransferase family 2 protein [Gemmataceae bacterium]